jgi:hypothetical protein
LRRGEDGAVGGVATWTVVILTGEGCPRRLTSSVGVSAAKLRPTALASCAAIAGSDEVALIVTTADPGGALAEIEEAMADEPPTIPSSLAAGPSTAGVPTIAVKDEIWSWMNVLPELSSCAEAPAWIDM